jgi:hypothetical protein
MVRGMDDPADRTPGAATDDEARWAAAQSVLDRAPTTTAQQCRQRPAGVAGCVRARHQRDRAAGPGRRRGDRLAGGRLEGALVPALIGAEPAQHRVLLAQVTGRVPADPARLPLTRNMAERMLLQRQMRLVWVGLCLQQVGRAVRSTGAVSLTPTAATLMAYLIGLLLLGRAARRAGRFLRDLPAPRADAEPAS